MTKIKVLLIDPATLTITPMEIETGIDAIYKALECETFECPVDFDNGDTLYCDEEGKLKGREGITGGITYPKNWDPNNPVVNKCLVIGQNRNTGDSANCKSTPDYILNNPQFGKLKWIPKEIAEQFAF